MKMYKHFIYKLGFLTLVSTVLVSCGGGNSSDSTISTTPTSSGPTASTTPTDATVASSQVTCLGACITVTADPDNDSD
jgi:hypothetical protein